MSEKLSPEEFFERARKGEFLGAEVTIIDKPITFTITESGLDEWAAEEGLDEWFVGDKNFGLWEGCADRVDHLIVTIKEEKRD